MKALRVAGIAVVVIIALLAAALGGLYALFDGNKIKAELSRVVWQETQRKLLIEGSPRLTVWPDLGVQLDGVTLTEHASEAEFLALKSARISVALMPLLSRQVQVRALDVVGLKMTVVKKKDGSLNVADLLGEKAGADALPKSPAPAEPVAPVRLDVVAIHLRDAQLTWRDERAGSVTTLSQLNLATGPVQADTAQKTVTVNDFSIATQGQSGTDTFALKVDAPRLVLSPQKSAGEAIAAALTLTGPGRRVAAQLTLSGVEGNGEALKIGNLALALDATSGEATVKGQLRSPVAVDLTAHTVALAQLTGKLDVAHPGMPMKQITLPVTASLRANWEQQTAALDWRTQLDASKVVGKVAVSRFAPLALVFDLDVDQLNVDTYLPPKAAGAGGGAGGGEKGAGKDAELDFSALKGRQISGAIHIGALQVSGLKVAQLNAKLAVSGGRLDVAPLAMNLYGGSTSGSLMVNAAGNAVALRQNLSGISINPLMKDLLNKDMLEGRGNVAVDITSRGATVGAMKKALTGSAALSLRDGAIKGINLAQSLRDIKSKLGQPDATQQAKVGEKTDFSELTATLKIANGVAHNDDLVMKSPFLRLGGAGDIDIGEGRMNYLAKATVVGSAEGQGGKAADQLKGLTVPVRVSGPFEGLSYKLEFASMVSDVAKARVEEKKQEIKTQVEEKAKDLLKGLLGR